MHTYSWELIKANMKHIRVKQEHVRMGENNRGKRGKGIWFDIFLSTSSQQGFTFYTQASELFTTGPSESTCTTILKHTVL